MYHLYTCHREAWHVLYDTPIDNNWYGDDAKDIAFGLESCDFIELSRTLKSLDNSTEIKPRNEIPRHQQIQYDKQETCNLLAATGMVHMT